MERFYSMTQYCKERFGKKLYRIALDGGFSCPNRENGSGGCIFCSENGSGDFAFGGDDMDKCIGNAKQRVSKKAANSGYSAYFQANTGTFAPPERLMKTYAPIVERDDIDVLSIATRPDCLDDGVMDVLGYLSSKKPVWVELGLQTADDEIARLINRGYPTSTYLEAVRRLKEMGIDVITHAIIGLPGETDDTLIDTMRVISEARCDGIKLHLLHVLKNTRLYEMYAAEELETLEMTEYFRRLSLCLEHLSPNVAIHRLTGDGDKRILVSPMWSADKKRVLNSMHRYFEEHDVIQGKFFRGIII